jgi:hypothetical protein
VLIERLNELNKDGLGGTTKDGDDAGDGGSNPIE